MTGTAKIGVIGAGWWSWVAHLPSLARNPQVDLIAVCDPRPERAAAAAQEFGIAATYTDAERLLSHPGLDGVVIATPHTTHFPLVSAAIDAGLHVLVEKPMATTGADAWTMVDRAREADRILSVGLTYQYAQSAPRVRDAVGSIGELVSVNAEFSSNTIELFATTANNDNTDDPSAPHGSTYADPALSGGGQAQTQLTHLLGGLLWAARDQAAQVTAFMDNRSLAVDVVDALSFRLNSGTLCVASSTGTTPGGAPVRHQIRFHGTQGVVEWDMLHADAWMHRAGGDSIHIENAVDLPTYPRGESSAAFARAIVDGAPTPAPADYAAASASLIEAAYRAADLGRIVEVTQGVLR